jgi:hypothetical protein
MAFVVAHGAGTRSNFSIMALTYGLIGVMKLHKFKALLHELSHC